MGKRSKRRKFKDENDVCTLSYEVKKAIAVVVVFSTALIFFLSLFGYAGYLGTYVRKALFYIFGAGAWIFPIIMIVSAYFLVRSKERKYQIIKITAAAVFVFVYSALLNLRIALPVLFEELSRGKGGGYLGVVLSYPLLKLTGFWVSFILLLALGIISLLIVVEKRLFVIGKIVMFILSHLPFAGIFSEWKHRMKDTFKKEPEYIESLPAAVQPQPVDVTKQKDAVTTTVKNENAGGDAWKKQEVGTKAEDSGEAEELTMGLRSRYRRKIDIPLSLLNKRTDVPSSGDIKSNKEKIQKALENFGIQVEMSDSHTGPTVTQYTLKPHEGVKLAQITALHNDLALALAAHPIRIEAPIPGKSLVGIEVPNSVIAKVGVREILQSEVFRNERKSNLTIALGKDVSGAPYIADLEKMPHLLIAGATGSGKSMCINIAIMSFLYQNSPDDLKFILIDPKRVELTIYNGIPHLLTPVITDAKKTINALKWTVEEMERRYDVLSEAGDRNIEAFNRHHDEHLPYIIIIIDELADLMSVAAKEVEALIVRLAQMARAVGIHLVLATQRPSVNVITGLIKANITARIAFAVASQTDSRTILDSSGAEKLLGRADMLFVTAELTKPKRLQGAFVDDKETKRVIRFLKDSAEPDYLEEIIEKKSGFTMPSVNGMGIFSEGDGDELLDEAREIIVRAGKASASYLQRYLRIGYARAARILDLLEAEGTIGPGDGAKPREVLVRKTETETEEIT